MLAELKVLMVLAVFAQHWRRPGAVLLPRQQYGAAPIVVAEAKPAFWPKKGASAFSNFYQLIWKTVNLSSVFLFVGRAGINVAVATGKSVGMSKIMSFLFIFAEGRQKR